MSAINGPIATKRKANISIDLYGSNATIRFDLGHDSDLAFSRSNIEFTISQLKMVRLPRNEKQTYRLNSMPQMWPSGLTLAITLTLNFQGQIWNLLYVSQNGSIAKRWKANISINFRAQMWSSGLTLAMTLTLNFQGQIMNSLYLSKKCPDCHETINISIELKASNMTIRFDLGQDLDLEFSR